MKIIHSFDNGRMSAPGNRRHTLFYNKSKYAVDRMRTMGVKKSIKEYLKLPVITLSGLALEKEVSELKKYIGRSFTDLRKPYKTREILKDRKPASTILWN